MIEYLKLLRPFQYYKNLVIFTAILFTGKIFYLDDMLSTILGFVALCLMSSVNYVINDIVDAKEDRKHPEKKHRPIASNKIGVFPAILLASILFVASIGIAFTLPMKFLTVITALFMITQVYTFFFKKEPFIDISVIGLNFVLRAVAGALIIGVVISPWLMICAFFLAMFLAISKRKADLLIMKTGIYDMETINMIMPTVLGVLLVSYTFYTFLKAQDGLILTIPIVTYSLMRYSFLTNSGSDIARNPEKSFTDTRLLLSIILWGLLVFASMYII